MTIIFNASLSNPLEVTRFNYRSAARHEVGCIAERLSCLLKVRWSDKRIRSDCGAADFLRRRGAMATAGVQKAVRSV